MSESFDEDFARRLGQIADSVAGLSEDEAVQVLDLRLKRAQLTGAARHRLSLAQARGTLARALGAEAEAEVLTSLEQMVTTIAETAPADMPPLGAAAPLMDATAASFDVDLATDVARLLDRHRDNAITVLGLIAQATTSGNTALVSALDALLEHDLEALSELEGR
ncbi:hypothetical protein [Nocardioides sp.]|uniref:hypothetical protein n=1 Tax=Nocardioides sp. TaxID=35761 RepID=UPI002634A3A9|nr:hypothetical protein [Nocardioides sp.]